MVSILDCPADKSILRDSSVLQCYASLSSLTQHTAVTSLKSKRIFEIVHWQKFHSWNYFMPYTILYTIFIRILVNHIHLNTSESNGSSAKVNLKNLLNWAKLSDVDHLKIIVQESLETSVLVCISALLFSQEFKFFNGIKFLMKLFQYLLTIKIIKFKEVIKLVKICSKLVSGN